MSSFSPRGSAAVALAAVLFLSSCGIRRPAAAGTGEIVVSTDVPEALLYLDGRFMGFLSSGGEPLRLQLSPGEKELRATAPGHVDVYDRITLRPGERVRVTAAFGRAGQGGGQPSWAPLIGSGQVVRGRVGPGRDENGKPRFTTVGVFDALAGQRWNLAVNVSLFPLDVALVLEGDPSRRIRARETGEQMGFRARQIFEFTLPVDGRYRVQVRSRPGVPENLFLLRVLRGPPPFAEKGGKGQARRKPVPVR